MSEINFRHVRKIALYVNVVASFPIVTDKYREIACLRAEILYFSFLVRYVRLVSGSRRHDVATFAIDEVTIITFIKEG